jgi:AraC-like DNA-binding protein
MSLIEPFRHTLPVDDSRFDDAVYLTHFGWERIGRHAPYPLAAAFIYRFDWERGRTLPESCLALLTDGAGMLETAAGQVALEAGDAFLVRPGEWHRHRPLPQTGWTLLWVCYHGEEAIRWQRESLYKLDGNQPVIEDQVLFRAQFEHLLVSGERCHPRNPPTLTYQLLGLLSHFLSDASGTATEDGSATGDEVVDRAVDFIWNFSHRNIDVGAVAQHVGLARRTLDRRFMAARNCSVLAEIQECRLGRAARLLKNTGISISDIAMRAGFSSEEHLRLAFRKKHGIPPNEYRRRHAEGD